jgi:hypothetical protein
MSVAQTCNVDDCNKLGVLHKNGKRYFTKGMCGMHYQRQKYGIPDVTVYTHRPAIIEGNIAKIPLGINAKDGYAIVDADMAWIDKYQWYLASTGYAMTNADRKQILLHHLLLGKPEKGMVTDHINRDRLDNRKSNLRFCTSSQNNANRGIDMSSEVSYKGVYFDKRRNKFIAAINGNYIGGYKKIRDAAEAYDKVAFEKYGEFAYLNFQNKQNPSFEGIV